MGHSSVSTNLTLDAASVTDTTWFGVLVTGAAPRVEKQEIKYRSYKNFSVEIFKDDVNRVPFHAAFVFDDVHDIY